MLSASNENNQLFTDSLRALTVPDELERRRNVSKLITALDGEVAKHVFANTIIPALASFAYGPMPREREKSIARYDADEFLVTHIASLHPDLQCRIFSIAQQGLEAAWLRAAETLAIDTTPVLQDIFELALKSGSRWGFELLSHLAQQSGLPAGNYSTARKVVDENAGLVPHSDQLEVGVCILRTSVKRIESHLSIATELVNQEPINDSPSAPKMQLKFGTEGPFAWLFAHRTPEQKVIERYREAVKRGYLERSLYLAALRKFIATFPDYPNNPYAQ